MPIIHVFPSYYKNLKIVDKEHWFELRNNWLSELGLTYKDILPDEGDGEYVMVEPNLMDEGEIEDGKFVRVYLPDRLNSSYILSW